MRIPRGCIRSCLVLSLALWQVALTQTVRIQEISNPSIPDTVRSYNFSTSDGGAALATSGSNTFYLWKDGAGLVELTFPPNANYQSGLNSMLSDDGITVWASATSVASPFRNMAVHWSNGAAVGTALELPLGNDPTLCGYIGGGTNSVALLPTPMGTTLYGSYQSLLDTPFGEQCLYNGLFLLMADIPAFKFAPSSTPANATPLVYTPGDELIIEEYNIVDGAGRYLVGMPGGPYREHPINAYLAGRPPHTLHFCTDGVTVFLSDTTETPPAIYRWRESTGAVRISPPSASPQLEGQGSDIASPDGSALVGIYGPGFNGFYWSDATGFRDLAELINDQGGAGQFSRYFPSSISDDGTVVFAMAQTFDDPPVLKSVRITLAFAPPDADGDGLLDEWERDGGGIDVDGDSIVDLSLFELGARPNRKDLFLEIDGTRGFFANPNVVAMLSEAFSNAPVPNPGGIDGIALHVDTTGRGIDAPEEVLFEGQDWPPLFDTIKQVNFGTNEDRANPKRLEAKRKFVRYCLVFDHTDRGEGGRAENIHGDDFYINMGFGQSLMSDPVEQFDQADYDLDTALLIMHEFGHTLGLHHGGGDDINGKPNYPSIMNYCLAHVAPFNESFLRLDYSATQMPTLFENNLDEHLGIGGGGPYANFRMPIGFSQPGFLEGSDFRFVTLAPIDGTPLDMGSVNSRRLDGAITRGATQDINLLMGNAALEFANTASPGQTLNGFNDWANIRYALPPASRRNQRNPVPEDSYLAIRAFLHQISPVGAALTQGWAVY